MLMAHTQLEQGSQEPKGQMFPCENLSFLYSLANPSLQQCHRELENWGITPFTPRKRKH